LEEAVDQLSDRLLMMMFSKKAQILNFIKVCPVGAELFHVDRHTDMMKLIVTFHNFVNATNNESRSAR
jgi:hypothetical protein